MKYLLIAFCVCSFSVLALGLSPDSLTDVIYGTDNRLDLYQIQDPAVLAVADSTVALVEATDLSTNAAGNFILAGAMIGEDMGLCKTEPFYSQQEGAFCSGFLVAPDTIVTAGHCIPTADACNTTKFAFGFSIKQLGQKYNEFAPSEIVGCKSVVHTQQVSNGADFAVVKLDRNVLNHMPLKLGGKQELSVGAPVFVVGHPTGLPTKVAGGANVRSNATPGFFVANLDTYGGNSGSAVFNAQSLQVEGVLVRGELDYIYQGDCRVSNVCTNDGCRGEDVTRISSVEPYL